MMIRIAVVFPAPLAPTNPVRVPGVTVKLDVIEGQDRSEPAGELRDGEHGSSSSTIGRPRRTEPSSYAQVAGCRLVERFLHGGPSATSYGVKVRDGTDEEGCGRDG